MQLDGLDLIVMLLNAQLHVNMEASAMVQILAIVFPSSTNFTQKFLLGRGTGYAGTQCQNGKSRDAIILID